MTHRITGSRRAPLRVLRGIALLLLFAFPLAGQSAQPTGHLAVTVSEPALAPVIGARVRARLVSGVAVGSVVFTRATGRALLGPLPAGSVTLEVVATGYHAGMVSATVVAGDTTEVSVILVPSVQDLGTISVVARRDDVRELRVDREQIASRTPHDPADILRELPGTDVMRRGGTAADPVVRGLRDTQIGVYVDAARTFPGGPAGMDTPMSHVDPAHVQEIQVLAGPYALTWGAGNLSAIRMTTLPLPSSGSAPLRGRLTTGYDDNIGAYEAALGLDGAVGTTGAVRYALGGAYRQGSDYTAGDGTIVPGDFTSAEGRGRVGIRTGDHGTLGFLGSYQAQRDIDYPGRPLDADFFNTYHLQAEWSLRRPAGLGSSRLRDLDIMAYVYDVDHLMDNDEKPTALPDPGRMPPFATDVRTGAGVQVLGGRFAARMAGPANWEVEVGGDIYHADHDASREVDRRDTGAPVRRDLIWGGAWIRDAGVFVRATRAVGRAELAMAARMDVVRADADTASPFFIAQHGNDFTSSETNWSGAVTLRVPVAPRWTVTGGLGSVVRTAEANERFSDRAAAKRAQTNAEFLGDPALRPERSTQADLWVEARYPRLQVRASAFVRRMDDYITLAATDLPRAMPGSPPPVFRFINGEAVYHGGDLTLASPVSEAITASGSVSYLYGQDRTLDEPALGVTPVRADLRLRIAPVGTDWFLEPALHVAARQERVATTRGELATPGWTTVDLVGGYRLWSGSARSVLLQGGVRNVLDAAYVMHLTARNAFGGGRIPEPGRIVFARITATL